MNHEMLSREHCAAELADIEYQINLESSLLKRAMDNKAATAAQKHASQMAKLKSRRNLIRATLEAMSPRAPTNPDQVWAEFLNEVLPNLAPARLEELRRRVTEIIGEPLRLVYDADAERARNG